jgi:hypothetical protein
MSSELKQMYELGLLDASAYVLLIVKTHGTAGWKSTFKVKDFARKGNLQSNLLQCCLKTEDTWPARLGN